MNETDIENENLMGRNSQHAVSIYRQDDGVEDFPVLKAFQQYIDAEQEKSRKRILILGIVFGLVLIVVIAVFMILLHGINTRNQQLSDRLVEYAMSEASRRVPVSTHSANIQDNTALKTMAESFVALQKQLLEKDISPSDQPGSNSRAASDDAAKIQRAKDQIAEERRQLAAEKERLRQIEIEQQRRKLYPELYRDKDSDYVPDESRKPQQRIRALTDDDIREIIREAYPANSKLPDDDVAYSEAEMQRDNNATQKHEDEAIEYFKDDDYTIPIDGKGHSSAFRFTVPVR